MKNLTYKGHLKFKFIYFTYLRHSISWQWIGSEQLHKKGKIALNSIKARDANFRQLSHCHRIFNINENEIIAKTSNFPKILKC